MTVYVVQCHRKRDPNSGEFVPVYDLSTALQYGEIVELVSPTAVPYNPGPLLNEMSEKLALFDPVNDWLLPMGNPLIIGWAYAIAADNTNDGHVRSLLWSGRDKAYTPVEARLFP